MVNPPVE